MTNIQKIKSEIKLQITNLEAAKKEGFITEFGMGKLECLDGLLSFIDSELSQPMNKTSDQEKPAGDDFKAFEQQYMNDNYDEIVCIYDRYAGLVDGARWQKQQMTTYIYWYRNMHLKFAKESEGDDEALHQYAASICGVMLTELNGFVEVKED